MPGQRTLILALVLLAVHIHGDPVTVTADFAQSADYPLIKSKFAVFNSGIVPLSRYQRDIALYDEVRPDSLRIDLGWGGHWCGWTKEPVTGTADTPQFDFTEMDAIASLLHDHNVGAYWSYCYIPDPLKPSPRGWRGPPKDPNAWGKVLAGVASHYRNTTGGNPVTYQEVYNEPDNRDFFRGSLDDYLALYRTGSAAMRQADPDAMIGGPALAFTVPWVKPFLDTVSKEKLPLDFFSFHYYPGVPTTPRDLPGLLKAMYAQVDAHPEFATTELHLNEYNAYKIDYPQGGRQDHFPLASAFLDDVAFFLTQPALTRIHWAQFQDSARGNYSGMISLDGHRKAVFNAYALYARMPVDRRRLKIDGPQGVSGLSSADERHAMVLLWNRSGTDRDVAVSLQHLVPDGGRLHVFRIDAHHASWGDDPTAERLDDTEPIRDVHGPDATWSGNLPADAVVCLDVERPGVEARPWKSPGRLVRELHDTPNRSSKSYAQWERADWTAYLGMAGEHSGQCTVGVTAENVAPKIHVTVHGEGLAAEQTEPATGVLSLRVDYQSGGAYTKSITLHGPVGGIDLFGGKIPPPRWGTSRDAVEVVKVPDFGEFDVDLAAHAPAGWSGRVQLTATLRNAAPGARAQVRIGAAQ